MWYRCFDFVDNFVKICVSGVSNEISFPFYCGDPPELPLEVFLYSSLAKDLQSLRDYLIETN